MELAHHIPYMAQAQKNGLLDMSVKSQACSR